MGGLVGRTGACYALFGPVVAAARRLEATCAAGAVQASAETAALAAGAADLELLPRGACKARQADGGVPAGKENCRSGGCSAEAPSHGAGAQTAYLVRRCDGRQRFLRSLRSSLAALLGPATP